MPAVMLTNEIQVTWDGSYYELATCGNDVSCYEARFVPPGRYIAHLCATPGFAAPIDGGVPVCMPSGDDECATVEFAMPGPPVEAVLPPLR